MAKKASSKTSGAAKKAARPKASKKTSPKTRSVATRSATTRNKSSTGDTVRKLLESPLVADLLAVGATAALAAVAEHGFGRGKGEGKGTGKTIKQAGKAAAAAMGQRLSGEFDEIRKAAKSRRGAGS